MPEQSSPSPAPVQDHVLQFFGYEHLRDERMRMVSKCFCDLAHALVEGDNGPQSGTVTLGEPVPRNPERTKSLNALLEAKDAAVRALLAK